MIGTKQAAAILGVRPGTLTRAIWEGRIPAPAKGPGGAYVWSRRDIERASWVLRHCSAANVLPEERGDR